MNATTQATGPSGLRVAAATSAFRIDGTVVSRRAFDRAALDPAGSVVIQACAGSGKTWLLVARLLRLLIAGAKPSEILAITFTRRAAEEMQARLMELLERLAVGSREEALSILTARGLDPESAVAALPRARGLFEALQTAATPLTIETFHGWFARIVRGAPLAAGIPAGFAILEQTGELKNRAWRDVLNLLARDTTLRDAYLQLLHEVGELSGHALIDALFRRRNVWRAFLGTASLDAALRVLRSELQIEPVFDSPPGQEPKALEEAACDPVSALLNSSAYRETLRRIAESLSLGSSAESQRARRALQVLDAGPAVSGDDVKTLRSLVLCVNGSFQEATKKARAAAQMTGGEEAERVLSRSIGHAAEAFLAAEGRASDLANFALNRAVWICTEALLEAYALQKRAAGVLDFDDLEWSAYELAGDEASAAYIQTRLDARYRHVLVDEFQDTNPMQWSVLRHWLQGYGGDTGRPAVFIVGDPRQSIYRFRGADSLLFAAAARFLQEHFAARYLSTDETRRCAPAIVALLNGVFVAPYAHDFTPHETQNQVPGVVWRIDLVARENAADELPSEQLKEVAADGAAPGDIPDSSCLLDEGTPPDSVVLRDPLTTPFVDPLDSRREAEAGTIARLIRALVGSHLVDGEPGSPVGKRTARYQDVLILVRQRNRMAPIERALRTLSVPYSSDRSGGLLATLEALDLSALLRFLIVPFSDHLLAHVLRTPLFAATDADLVRLAQRSPVRQSWWQSLAGLGPDDPLAPHYHCLARWVDLAGVLPVHDLLDRIYDEGRVVERYVAALDANEPQTVREQVRANLLAYMELALEMDSGRFPSLSRFVEELDLLARGSQQDAPDEGIADFGDTVRILTIHGAKGLEAPIVFIADSNTTALPNRPNDVLVKWPVDSEAPQHVSVFGVAKSRGVARASLFETERALAEREDANLLYVATTRAREVLVLSGIDPARGEADGSWYARCAPFAGRIDVSGFVDESPEAPAATVEIANFRPAPHPVGRRDGSAPLEEDALAAGRLRGLALHRVLELLPGGAPERSAALRIARAMPGMTGALAEAVADQALGILNDPALRRFFTRDAYRSAWAEVELLDAKGTLHRIDRLVEFDDEVWILDFKSHASDCGIEPHREQLERYLAAVRGLRRYDRLRAGVIFGDAVLIEMTG